MNKAILIGNLTNAPEIRTTQSGISCVNATIAVNRRFKGADGEKLTDFIPVVLWRQQANYLRSYARKGDKIAVEGTIQIRSYEKDGAKRYVAEVIADSVEILKTQGVNNLPSPPAVSAQSEPQADDQLPF